MRTLRESWLLLGRNLIKLSRTYLLVFLSLLQSMLWLILLPLSFQKLQHLPEFQSQGYESYLMFFTPSALALTAISVAFQSGVGMVTDIDQGVLDKLLINPIRRSSILVGRVLTDATRIVVQGTAILIVALLMGGYVKTGASGAAIMLLQTSCFGVAWSGFSNMVALRTRNSEATYLVGALLTFPMLFLSTAIMPPALLPSWLEHVSGINPVTYVVDANRSVMNFGYSWHEVGAALGIAFVIGSATLAGATRAFRKSLT